MGKVGIFHRDGDEYHRNRRLELDESSSNDRLSVLFFLLRALVYLCGLDIKFVCQYIRLL